MAWYSISPPLRPKYIGEKTRNVPEVKLLALKYTEYGSLWWLPCFTHGSSCHVLRHFFIHIHVGCECKTHTMCVQSRITTSVNQPQHHLESYVTELLFTKDYSTETWPKLLILDSLFFGGI